MSRTLYQLEGCPWCEKVADKLDDLGLEYDSVWTEALHSKRNEVMRISNQRKVPVLVDDEYGVTMPESARIIEFLETVYGEQSQVTPAE